MRCGVSGIPLPVIEWRRRDFAERHGVAKQGAERDDGEIHDGERHDGVRHDGERHDGEGNDAEKRGAGAKNSEEAVKVAPVRPSAEWLAKCLEESKRGRAPCAPVAVEQREEVFGSK